MHTLEMYDRWNKVPKHVVVSHVRTRSISVAHMTRHDMTWAILVLVLIYQVFVPTFSEHNGISSDLDGETDDYASASLTVEESVSTVRSAKTWSILRFCSDLHVLEIDDGLDMVLMVKA